ncbi:MAG TPA: SDR family oxidoreductase [Candidatus Angelobacter sp.]|nr:SDR family oxidoreductase [Candidatus Angelobacter sp.]
MTTNHDRPFILVTGGAGYIGCRLVPTLLEAGYRVRVFDVMFYGDAGLREVRERIEVVEGDIRCIPPGLLDGVFAIINLAGLSTEPAAEYRPEANQEINFVAAVKLAALAKDQGVRRFIQASSGSIYDVGAGHADKDILHTEDSPVEPFRIYSITKREAEKKILAMSDKDFTPVVLRKGSVYGYSPRMRFDLVVNAFTLNALQTGQLVLHNGGEMWRPLLSIQDAAAAYKLMLAAPAEKVSGEIFNVTNGNYRISELALRVQNKLAEMRVPCEIRPDYNYRNLRSCQASGKKICEKLGFTPKVTVEQTVEELVQKIRGGAFHDPYAPAFHNIRWLDLLEEARTTAGYAESVFSLNSEQLRELRATVSKQRSAVA